MDKRNRIVRLAGIEMEQPQEMQAVRMVGISDSTSL